jgi:hypothetical protein
MELGAIFLIILVLVMVVLFVARPFTKDWRAKGQSTHEISALLAERERALTALMELDFDNEIGKIPAEEYTVQRAGLIQKGSDILRKLDELQAKEPSAKVSSSNPSTAEPIAKLVSEEDLEDLIAKRRANRQQKTAGFCPNCGKPVLQSDLFCPSCGQMLNSK